MRTTAHALCGAALLGLALNLGGCGGTSQKSDTDAGKTPASTPNANLTATASLTFDGKDP